MAGEDPAYAERVAGLPCCAAGLTPCVGPVQCHHRSTGRVSRPVTKGADRRAHDHDSMPLCLGHHGAWHNGTGPFKILIKPERVAWEDEMVFRTQRILKPIPKDDRP